MRTLGLMLLVVSTSGCGALAKDVGFAGAHPGRLIVDCGPEGASLQVQGNIAAMIYGSNNAASVQCKGKLTIEQGPPPPGLSTPLGAK